MPIYYGIPGTWDTVPGYTAVSCSKMEVDHMMTAIKILKIILPERLKVFHAILR